MNPYVINISYTTSSCVRQYTNLNIVIVKHNWDDKPYDCMTYTIAVCTVKNPDDGQRNCPKHVEFYSKNKLEKLVHLVSFIIRLTPNDPYRGRTVPLTSKRCILYIYSTHIGTEYFKHGIYSPIFSLQNAVCFIILKYLVPVLFTFYIQGVIK